MNKDLRWRIISLQVVMIVLFAFGGGLALYAGNFTQDQIANQLRPQEINFPADTKSGLPADLQQFAGQQVLTGEQAHAYADKFIAVHLAATGQGHPYSYWSTQARAEKDPAKKAAISATVDTMFRGETLRSMLNQAWAFGTMGSIATYAGYGLIVATLVVLAALAFELFIVPSRVTKSVLAGAMEPAS